MKSELTQYVDKALSRRLNEENNNFTNSTQLLGDCLFNTKVLSEVLTENDVSHTIYGGALREDYGDNDIPESFGVAKKIGLVHYWIEVNGYVCEISSESKHREYFGQSVVLPSRPSNYIVFEDSKLDNLL